MSPITPHITEEIYNNYFNKIEKEKSIHLTNWPKPILEDKKAEKIGDRFIQILSKVRQFKNQHHKSLKTEIDLVLDEKDKFLKPALEDLKATTKARSIKFKKFKISF